MRDWERKRFLKLYTVDSPAWLRLSFDAQGLFLLILRKLDFRYGIDLSKHGVDGLAALLGHRNDVDRIAAGLNELTEVGFVAIEGQRLTVPTAKKHFGFDSDQYASLRNKARQMLDKVIAACFGKCSYCGSLDGLEVDHVLPLSRGGDNSPENLVAACRTCNASKGARTLEEWRRT